MEPLCLDDVRAYGRVPPLLECWSLQSVSYRVRVFNHHDLHLGKSAICKELIFFRDVLAIICHRICERNLLYNVILTDI